MYAARYARETPDKPAIIMASTGETITFAEYEARCNRVAHLLRDAGLQQGDHISILMENDPRMLEIEGGAERVGVYFTLVNAYLAPDEVAYIVNNSRIASCFSPPWPNARWPKRRPGPARRWSGFSWWASTRPPTRGSRTRMRWRLYRPTMCLTSARGGHAVLLGDHRAAERHHAGRSSMWRPPNSCRSSRA